MRNWSEFKCDSDVVGFYFILFFMNESIEMFECHLHSCKFHDHDKFCYKFAGFNLEIQSAAADLSYRLCFVHYICSQY